jgi:ring-1,2-phenylacetyl-CoA epoxidase subunit PaaE
MTPTFHRLKISELQFETEDAVSICFDVPAEHKEAYKYEAGQYVTIRQHIGGEELRRSYSICKAPNEGKLCVVVKKVEDGRFSTYATSSLSIGDELDVMTPMGHFQHKADVSEKKSYVLFAAGSGVTPVIAIAKNILFNEPNSDVTMVYGNKGFSSIIFREELENLKNLHMNNFRLIHVLSRENLGNKIQKGRIDEEKVTAIANAFLANQEIDGVYICGPESMIHAVKNSMMSFGVPENRIHFELFGTTAPKKEKLVEESEIVHSKVTIILDDDQYIIDLDSNGKSILEAGYDVGADLPYACKGGVCCTCKAKILEGTAEMDINYALEKEEVEAGYILTCQAHPTSKELVVSFDE